MLWLRVLGVVLANGSCVLGVVLAIGSCVLGFAPAIGLRLEGRCSQYCCPFWLFSSTGTVVVLTPRSERVAQARSFNFDGPDAKNAPVFEFVNPVTHAVGGLFASQLTLVKQFRLRHYTTPTVYSSSSLPSLSSPSPSPSHASHNHLLLAWCWGLCCRFGGSLRRLALARSVLQHL